MKTLVLSVLAILTIGFAAAQETPVELEDVTVSSKNAKFLNLVQDEHTPTIAVDLQAEAATYDLMRSPIYRGSGKSDYFVEFQSDKGSMYTTYNREGEITRCMEKYNDIALPKAVRDQVFEDHKGWGLADSEYSSLYKNSKIAKREYRVKIKNGKSSKVITVDLNEENQK